MNWKPVSKLADELVRDAERERLWKKCVQAFEDGNFEVAEAYHDKMVAQFGGGK